MHALTLKVNTFLPKRAKANVQATQKMIIILEKLKLTLRKQ
jgi:hypothetical protein